MRASLRSLGLSAGLIAGLTVATGPAAAASNPVPPSALAPSPEAEPSPEFEPGRTAAQFAIGAVLATAPVLVMYSDQAFLMVFLSTPAIIGGTTCAIGRQGQNDGSCLATILGAYAGAATIVPLAYLGARTDEPLPEGQSDFYLGNAAIGIAVGWFLLQPLGATLGWHFSRSPKAAVSLGPPLAPAGRRLTPPGRGRRDRINVGPPPMLSLRF